MGDNELTYDLRMKRYDLLRRWCLRLCFASLLWLCVLAVMVIVSGDFQTRQLMALPLTFALMSAAAAGGMWLKRRTLWENEGAEVDELNARYGYTSPSSTKDV